MLTVPDHLLHLHVSGNDFHNSLLHSGTQGLRYVDEPAVPQILRFALPTDDGIPEDQLK